MTFQELGLNEPILRALADQGYEQPSPIQAKAIPPALTGRDLSLIHISEPTRH